MGSVTVANHRKSRGYKTQRNVADYLFDRGWTSAESVGAGEQGDDIKGVPFSLEVKARSSFQPLSWLKEIRDRNTGTFKPLQIVVSRMNGQGDYAGGYLAFMSFEQLCDLLQKAGYHKSEIGRCRKCGQWNMEGRVCSACGGK